MPVVAKASLASMCYQDIAHEIPARVTQTNRTLATIAALA
jgi:hypothetical protein